MAGSGGFCQNESAVRLDPGGSVRIRGVLSEWKVLSDWIRGVLSRIRGVLSESGVFCQECCQTDPGGSVSGSGGFCQKSAVRKVTHKLSGK